MDSTDESQSFSSFSCEIRIIQAKDIEFKSSKNVFVRYYLSAGNNNRIRLNTKEISSNSEFFWNEAFSLECLGTENSINSLKQASVVFELRKSKTIPVIGKISGSQLLGKVEIPWLQVFQSPKMAIDKWVSLDSAREDFKQPKLEIGMTVKIQGNTEMEKKKKIRRSKKGNGYKECCCENSKVGHCADHDIFALAAAMEFL